MASRTLSAEVRAATRKGAARKLRSAGRIPAVMYGHRDPVTLSINAQEFSRKFQRISESTIIELSAGDDTYDVLVKAFQYDNLANRLLHIDFFEIEPNKTLRTRVLLHFEGSAIGVREGGVQELLLHEVEVESLPKDLPEILEVDIEGLEIGQSIHVRDLEAPEGVRILNSEDQVVALVAHRAAEEEVAEVEEEEEALLGDEEAAEQASEAADDEQE